MGNIKAEVSQIWGSWFWSEAVTSNAPPSIHMHRHREFLSVEQPLIYIYADSSSSGDDFMQESENRSCRNVLCSSSNLISFSHTPSNQYCGDYCSTAGVHRCEAQEGEGVYVSEITPQPWRLDSGIHLLFFTILASNTTVLKMMVGYMPSWLLTLTSIWLMFPRWLPQRNLIATGVYQVKCLWDWFHLLRVMQRPSATDHNWLADILNRLRAIIWSPFWLPIHIMGLHSLFMVLRHLKCILFFTREFLHPLLCGLAAFSLRFTETLGHFILLLLTTEVYSFALFKS